MVKASEGAKGSRTVGSGNSGEGGSDFGGIFSQARELIEALLFAAVAALFIKTFIVEAYRIPTGSMETTLKVGDFLLVNKFIYDLKTPTSIPFTNVRLPHFSLGGMRSPLKGDIIVFEYPGDRDEIHHDEVVQYIKRCVGVPGDTVEVRDKMLYVNGVEFMHPPGMHFRIDLPELSSSGIHLIDSGGKGGSVPLGEGFGHQLVNVEGKNSEGSNNPYPDVSAEEYFRQPSKFRLNVESKDEADMRIFPQGAMWNHDNYGPLRVPKKGDVVTLDADGYRKWHILIRREGHTIDLVRNQVIVDGKPATSYALERNYYFMMGDNRDNSEDSRFWGFVPEDNIVGQAMVVYWSWDPSIPFSQLFKLIGTTRWSRIFHLIK